MENKVRGGLEILTLVAVLGLLVIPKISLAQEPELDGPQNDSEIREFDTAKTPKDPSGDDKYSLAAPRIVAHVFFWTGLGLLSSGIYVMTTGLQNIDTGGGLALAGCASILVGITSGIVYHALEYNRRELASHTVSPSIARNTAGLNYTIAF